MKKIYLFLILCLLTSYSASSIAPKKTRTDNKVGSYPHYDINLKITPESHEIQVKGSFEFNLNPNNTDSMFFYLEKNLKIKNLTINGKKVVIVNTSKSDNRYMPNAQKIYIKTENLPAKNKPIRINFSYQGVLDDIPQFAANKIGTEWTELGLYYPWFPYNPDRFRLFTYNLEVETNPQYKIYGIGEIETKDSITQIRSIIPTTDIIVCLSKDVQTYLSDIGQSYLRVYHHQLKDSLLHDIAHNVSVIIQHYNKWFPKKHTNICLIETKRKTGGGYARIGGVVLSKINQDLYYSKTIAYMRYFAHEFAHLWWFKAQTNSWEDWLNESFAEYSAFMVLREIYGQETFITKLEKKKENLEGTPPIWNFNRNNAEQKTVREALYNKGPVLLFDLEQKIGKEQFIKLCKNLLENDITTTSKFLEILKKENGKTVALWFENKLKTE